MSTIDELIHVSLTTENRKPSYCTNWIFHKHLISLLTFLEINMAPKIEWVLLWAYASSWPFINNHNPLMHFYDNYNILGEIMCFQIITILYTVWNNTVFLYRSAADAVDTLHKEHLCITWSKLRDIILFLSWKQMFTFSVHNDTIWIHCSIILYSKTGMTEFMLQFQAAAPTYTS